MFNALGLNSGSLISARNFSRSLTSPSYSVFTKRSATSSSRARESRCTCASFQSRSSTTSLFPCAELSALPLCAQTGEDSRAKTIAFLKIVVLMAPRPADARKHNSCRVRLPRKSTKGRLRMSRGFQSGAIPTQAEFSGKNLLGELQFDFLTVHRVAEVEGRTFLAGDGKIHVPGNGRRCRTLRQALFRQLRFHGCAVFVSRSRLRPSSANAHTHPNLLVGAARRARAGHRIVASTPITHADRRIHADVARVGSFFLQGGCHHFRACGLGSRLRSSRREGEIIQRHVQSLVLVRIQSHFHHHAAAVHVRHELLPGLLGREQYDTDPDAILRSMQRIAVKRSARNRAPGSGKDDQRDQSENCGDAP